MRQSPTVLSYAGGTGFSIIEVRLAGAVARRECPMYDADWPAVIAARERALAECAAELGIVIAA